MDAIDPGEWMTVQPVVNTELRQLDWFPAI